MAVLELIVLSCSSHASLPWMHTPSTQYTRLDKVAAAMSFPPMDATFPVHAHIYQGYFIHLTICTRVGTSTRQYAEGLELPPDNMPRGWNFHPTICRGVGTSTRQYAEGLELPPDNMPRGWNFHPTICRGFGTSTRQYTEGLELQPENMPRGWNFHLTICRGVGTSKGV